MYMLIIIFILLKINFFFRSWLIVEGIYIDIVYFDILVLILKCIKLDIDISIYS